MMLKAMLHADKITRTNHSAYGRIEMVLSYHCAGLSRIIIHGGDLDWKKNLVTLLGVSKFFTTKWSTKW
jgi:hypothetical protein